MMSTRLVAGFVVLAVLVTCSAAATLAHASAGPSETSHARDGHGSDGSAKGKLNPLEIKGDLAIWTLAVFLVLMAVLWRFAWGPIADGLAKREQRIADEIAGAEKTNADAREMLAEYQTKLASAEEEIRQMIDGAKRDAETVGQSIVDKARTEAEAEHRRKLEEIDLATAGALKELAERSATLAVELAGKIVDARLDPAAHSRLIEQAVSRFSATEPGNN